MDSIVLKLDLDWLYQMSAIMKQWFASKSETAGIKVCTFKSEATVLCWTTVYCSLWVGSELQPQVKHLWILFVSEGRMELEVDTRIGSASAVSHKLYCIIVVKEELIRKAKLSLYKSRSKFQTSPMVTSFK